MQLCKVIGNDSSEDGELFHCIFFLQLLTAATKSLDNEKHATQFDKISVNYFLTLFLVSLVVQLLAKDERPFAYITIRNYTKKTRADNTETHLNLAKKKKPFFYEWTNFMNEVDFYNSLARKREKGDRDGKNDNKWKEISGYYFIYSLLLSFRCFLWQLIEMKL